MDAARRDLNGHIPHGSCDAEKAYSRDASLAPAAAAGDSRRIREQRAVEADIRTDPQKRADRFVDRWNKLTAGLERAYVAGDNAHRRVIENEMRGMAKSLERDPQLESILANREHQLGITFESGRRLGAEPAFHQGIDLDLGRARGICM